MKFKKNTKRINTPPPPLAFIHVNNNNLKYMILYIGAYLTVSYTCVYFMLKYIINIYKTMKHRFYQINTVP